MERDKDIEFELGAARYKLSLNYRAYELSNPGLIILSKPKLLHMIEVRT